MQMTTCQLLNPCEAFKNAISYTLSLHDALPIFLSGRLQCRDQPLHFQHIHIFVVGIRVDQQRSFQLIDMNTNDEDVNRSEEHTSELQSQFHLVCRLLLEKKKRTPTLTTVGARNA